MTTATAPGVLDDLFWDDLLAYLDDRRVVPVIDTGALQVSDGARRMSLESLLATRLAERLRLSAPGGDSHPRLDDVVRLQRLAQGRRDNLYLRLQQLLKELDISPPQALIDLAAIDAFDLFISVSFDDLLARALEEVRGAGRVEVLAFAPNRSADLAQPRATLRRPTVFHLLGRLSSAPDSVIYAGLKRGVDRALFERELQRAKDAQTRINLPDLSQIAGGVKLAAIAALAFLAWRAFGDVVDR